MRLFPRRNCRRIKACLTAPWHCKSCCLPGHQDEKVLFHLAGSGALLQSGNVASMLLNRKWCRAVNCLHKHAKYFSAFQVKGVHLSGEYSMLYNSLMHALWSRFVKIVRHRHFSRERSFPVVRPPWQPRCVFRLGIPTLRHDEAR